MIKMPQPLLWLLHCAGVIINVISQPSLSLPLDIVLRVNTSNECLQPIVCRQGHGNLSWPWSLIISPGDSFALGKSVLFAKGNTVLLSSPNPSTSTILKVHKTENSVMDLCSVNCSTFSLKRKQLYVQSVYTFRKATRQLVFDSLNTDYKMLEDIAHGVKLLLVRDKWKPNILITSSYKELTVISSYIQSLASKLFLFTTDGGLHRNGTLDILYTQLAEEGLNIVLVCSAACIGNILNKIPRFSTEGGKNSKWLVIPTDGSTGDIFKSGMRVTNADIVLMDVVVCSKEKSSFTFRMLQDVLQRFQQRESPHREAGLADFIGKEMAHNNSLVASTLRALHPFSSNSVTQHVGYINSGGQVTIKRGLFPTLKYGLNNRILTVDTLEWPPFVFKTEENGSIEYSGVCIDLLKELSLSLNFSYKIVEPEDQEWGRVLNGRWTGLIGDLAYKKVDLAVAPFTQSDDRENVIDFTAPYYYGKSSLAYKKQTPSATIWMTLVAPFRYEVHICILLSLIFSTVFLFAVEEVHPVNTWQDRTLLARQRRMRDILWYHFGALMANGGSYLPTTQSGRSVLSCWWLFTVISAAIYSGNLVAVLTDWREEPPFTTVEDMVNQDTYRWGVLGGSSYVTLAENSALPVYRKLWQGLKEDPEATSLYREVHKRKLLKGNYVYLGDVSLLERWRMEDCAIQIYNDEFFPMNFAVGLTNNSVYTRLFSEQVVRINEAGLIEKWYKKWIPSGKCEQTREAKRVDLLALQSAFYAAGVGVLLAVSVLTAEVVYNRKFRKLELSQAESSTLSKPVTYSSSSTVADSVSEDENRSFSDIMVDSLPSVEKNSLSTTMVNSLPSVEKNSLSTTMVNSS